jgi:hypothetical protein
LRHTQRKGQAIQVKVKRKYWERKLSQGMEKQLHTKKGEEASKNSDLGSKEMRLVGKRNIEGNIRVP